MNDDSLTISSVYLEPNGDLDDINQIIFESDVIGGDMNKANTNLNKQEEFIKRHFILSQFFTNYMKMAKIGHLLA